MLPLAGDSQEPVPQFTQPKFMPINDSPRVASFLAFHNSWLATLARAVEEVWWK
jgi:hypothetical protein